jgi:hypothetical protein
MNRWAEMLKTFKEEGTKVRYKTVTGAGTAGGHAVVVLVDHESDMVIFEFEIVAWARRRRMLAKKIHRWKEAVRISQLEAVSYAFQPPEENHA